MGQPELIENLSSRDDSFLQRVENNARVILSRSPNDKSAQKILDAIEAERARRNPPVKDGWTKGRQGEPRLFMRNGAVIATVQRFETHGAEKGGYEISVFGERLEATPRNVEIARKFAEREVKKRLLNRINRTAD